MGLTSVLLLLLMLLLLLLLLRSEIRIICTLLFNFDSLDKFPKFFSTFFHDPIMKFVKILKTMGYSCSKFWLQLINE